MKPVTIGAHADISRCVDESMTAIELESGTLPVLATPILTAMMEKAACLAIESFLEDGETTVGTALDIKHTAATPVGKNVTAHAEITAVSGREITFTVTAEDETGQIGTGTHQRFLVIADRFMQKAQTR